MRLEQYEFDPIPEIAVDMVASGDLTPTDNIVLAVLLRHQLGRENWARVTIGTIAEAVGRTKRTVKRSIQHLKAAGLIAHEETADHAENWGGWRFTFLWMAGKQLEAAAKAAGGN